jgi:hypothetical protein
MAAGLLALALVRVIAFGAGGVAAWLAVHAFAPPAWHQPLICFLAGGLVGLLLFRVWTMVLTSFAGAVIMGYFGLCLGDALGKLHAVEFARERSTQLNLLCVGVTFLGLIVQFVLERRRVYYEREREEREYGFARRWGRYYGRHRWLGFRPGYYRRAG